MQDTNPTTKASAVAVDGIEPLGQEQAALAINKTAVAAPAAAMEVTVGVSGNMNAMTMTLAAVATPPLASSSMAMVKVTPLGGDRAAAALKTAAAATAHPTVVMAYDNANATRTVTAESAL